MSRNYVSPGDDEPDRLCKLLPKHRPQFDDWSAAFDYCRRTVGHPVTVRIIAPAADPGIWRLFPSGRAEKRKS